MSCCLFLLYLSTATVTVESNNVSFAMINTYRRALILLEKWLDKLNPGNDESVTSLTLATTFARAGQAELVDKMIAPFRTHRKIDEVFIGKFPLYHT